MNLIKIILVCVALCGLSACESVKEDARQTPIGSVVSGETTDADSYLQRVTQTNKSLDKDTWRPVSRDRF